MDKDIILKAENISKQYRLGLVGTGTLSHDLNRAWARLRGKPDPYATVGVVNDRSASKSSDYVWALKDINFEVKRGEILGIIGKNGAGKSTLLKILSRVTAPTTGSIKTRGRIASLLEVGTGMHPELTGRENIYLNGAILGMTKSEIASKIDEIVDFSGCEMYIDTPVKRYSSGMRVRLGFAVAAFLEPDILVVDEVLAVGDAEFQKKAIGKMQDISSTTGRTVLFVSHDMSAINSLCTRVIVLEDGKQSQLKSQDPVEAISYYLSSRTNKEIVKKNDLIKIQLKHPNKYRHDQDFIISLNVAESNFIGEVFIDIAVVNSYDEFVIHYQMKYDREPLKWDNSQSDFAIKIKNPGLLPGDYTLIFYIASKTGEVLYWGENMAAFQILANSSLPNLGKTNRANLIPFVEIKG